MTQQAMKIEYTVDGKGNIQLSCAAPFDGAPVLIKLASGWCEAVWEDAQISQGHDGTSYDGFCWNVMDGGGTADLDDVKLWAPLPDAEVQRSAASTVDAWQDISTAPRDGTPVLLWAEAWEMTWGTQIGSYSESGAMWETSEGRVQDNDLGFDPDEEFDEHDFDEDANTGPTHWQPVPAPPSLSRHDRQSGGARS